jgi:hypothetical protein
VFVEPYRKSKAKDLHDDAIEHVPPKGGKGGVDQTRVGFERFVGVGPRRFLDYYSMVLGDGYELVRKVDDSGKLRGWSRADAAPRAQWSDAGYESVESEVGRLFIEAMEEFRSGSGLKDLEGRLS